MKKALQNYIMIPLDIFKKCMQNKTVENKLEAWLTFLSEDKPDKIIELITVYPQFKAMYQTQKQLEQSQAQVALLLKELEEYRNK